MAMETNSRQEPGEQGFAGDGSMGMRSRRLLLRCFPSALQMDSPTQMVTDDPEGLRAIGTTGVPFLQKQISQSQNGACLAPKKSMKFPGFLDQSFSTAWLTPDPTAGAGTTPPDCSGLVNCALLVV